MRAGGEIIYQATFVQRRLAQPRPLSGACQPTTLGAWGYEALDAKLARAEKPT
jgi:hypothetical protein